MKTLVQLMTLIALGGMLLGCDPPPPPPQTQTPPCIGPRIVIGEISVQETDKEHLKPLADYLAKRLTPYGIACGQGEIAPTTDAMADLIVKGAVDIYFDSPYPAALVSAKTGGTPLVLRRQKKCEPDYYSVIYARTGSSITSIQDLPGNTIGMDNAESTSGFALAAYYLLEQGYKLVVKDTYLSNVAGDEVGIVFTGDDKNTLSWFDHGYIKVGVTDDYFFQNEIPNQTKVQTVLLWQSDPIVRQVVLLRPDLPSNLQAAIKDELLNADSNQEGLDAMNEGSETCKFDELPGGPEALLAHMIEIADKLKQIPGLP